MIITISGIAGSGKSSVAKALAEALGYKHYSIGDLMRGLAEEKGVSLMELSKQAETDKAIDKALDDKQVALGKSEDNFVIDSRLGFHFIRHSIKIFLDVELPIAAKRIFTQQRSKESYKDVHDSLDTIKARIASEDARYKEYYGIDYHTISNYDFLVDSNDLSVKEIVALIVKVLKKYGKKEGESEKKEGESEDTEKKSGDQER